MVAVKGAGEPEPRNSSQVSDSLKDYYEIEGRSVGGKATNKSLEKTYLQREKMKSGRLTSQDKY